MLNIKDYLSSITDRFIPKQYSMIEENNILGKYDEDTLVTKDENFVKAIKVSGVSYIAMNDNNISELFKARKNAILSISDDVNIKIVIKRRKKEFNKNYNIDNIYANKLINLWESNEEVFENTYIFIVETKSKSAIGHLENIKANMTTSIKEDSKDKDINVTYINKMNMINNILSHIMQSLDKFSVSIVSANELLSLYAEYCNGFYVPLKVDNGLLSDSYIASNVTFHKDYITQEWNGKKKYSRFISIKAYDTEYISSLFLSSLLYLEREINVFFYIEKLSKQKAISKITEKIKFSPPIVRGELDEMKQLIMTDRESMQYFTFIVMAMEDSKEELENVSKDISGIFTNMGLINTYETINQMPIYFSFFPNKETLNNRKRFQTTDAISTMLLLEKDISGFSTNSWGNYPLTIFKNQNKSPLMFNLHIEEGRQKKGHTMIIGGTGAGKTTLMSWLIINCFKYDINILALDKANGLYTLTNYLNGEYLDGNSETEPFHLNPFSLEYSIENQNFLVDWLCRYLILDKEEQKDIDSINAIEKVIDQTFRVLKQGKQEFNMSEIEKSIQRLENENIRLKLSSIAKDNLFNSLHDSVNLENKLSVINMDFIESKQKEAGLICYYLLYKMLYLAKNKSKGFFAFIDEFRTYANNPLINEKINYMITQARKLDGVVALAMQDLNQLDGVPNAESIIANMGTYIIFPTPDIKQFDKYNIVLSDYEKEFLSDSSGSRKVLIKNKELNTSNIVNVDLSKLGHNISFLSSNADDVNKIKNFKIQNPQQWRELYLKDKYGK